MSVGRFYSAVCPGCGSPVVDTLESEPDVPLYGCGAYGLGRTCPWPKRQAEAPNVHALTTGDAAELALIVDAADAGLLHVERARGR